MLPLAFFGLGVAITRSIYLPTATAHRQVQALMGWFRSLGSDQVWPIPLTVPCPREARSLLVLGQSNAANHVSGRFPDPIPSNLLQFDWETQRCRAYREPLLGASGNGGNPITPAAIALARASERPLVVTAVGWGSTTAGRWAHGDMAIRHLRALEAMQRHGLIPQVMLWHQGESDRDHPPASYIAAVETVIARTRQLNPELSVGLALATVCDSPPATALRHAQQRLASSHPQHFISADSDAIPPDPRHREGGCHFTPEGARLLAAQYVKTLQPRLR